MFHSLQEWVIVISCAIAFQEMYKGGGKIARTRNTLDFKSREILYIDDHKLFHICR